MAPDRGLPAPDERREEPGGERLEEPGGDGHGPALVDATETSLPEGDSEVRSRAARLPIASRTVVGDGRPRRALSQWPLPYSGTCCPAKLPKLLMLTAGELVLEDLSLGQGEGRRSSATRTAAPRGGAVKPVENTITFLGSADASCFWTCSFSLRLHASKSAASVRCRASRDRSAALRR